MSDHNERAFLQDKFKDFGAASETATKNVVMSEIQKKRRKKRFFIIFFISVFVISIGTIMTFYFNNKTTAENDDNNVESSKYSNNQNVVTPSSKVDLNNDKKQIETNEDKTLTENRVKRKGVKYTFSQKEGKYEGENMDDSESESERITNQSNTLITYKNEEKSQNNSILKKNTNIQRDLNKQLNKKRLNQVNKNRDNQGVEVNKDKTINDYSINKLTLKTISSPDLKVERSKLFNQDLTDLAIAENKWSVGIVYSYNSLRTKSPTDDNFSSDVLNPSSTPLNLVSETTNQELFSVSKSMNLDLSIIRKFKNKFYLESGIRYTNLTSFHKNEKMQDYLLGIPLKVGYSIPLKTRWAINLSTGINYNLSISRSEGNIDWSSIYTYSNFADFHLSTAELNAGISYFVNDRISFNISPKLSYLLFYKELSPKRYFYKNLWLGGQFGVYYHLQ